MQAIAQKKAEKLESLARFEEFRTWDHTERSIAEDRSLVELNSMEDLLEAIVKILEIKSAGGRADFLRNYRWKITFPTLEI